MKNKIFAVLICTATVVFLLLAFRRPTGNHPVKAEPAQAVIKSSAPAVSPQPLARHVPLQGRSKLKSRLSDFSDLEKAEFESNFAARYQPALESW